jgi:hypothetical protein
MSLVNALIARSSHLIPTLQQAWYAIPLRLIVGFGFTQHGYGKLARGRIRSRLFWTLSTCPCHCYWRG